MMTSVTNTAKFRNCKKFFESFIPGSVKNINFSLFLLPFQMRVSLRGPPQQHSWRQLQPLMVAPVALPANWCCQRDTWSSWPTAAATASRPSILDNSCEAREDLADNSIDDQPDVLLLLGHLVLVGGVLHHEGNGHAGLPHEVRSDRRTTAAARSDSQREETRPSKEITSYSRVTL